MSKTKISILKITRRLQLLMIAIAMTGIIGCSKNDGPAPEKEIAKSSVKQITSFAFLLTKNPIAVNIAGTLDEEAKTVTIAMPPNTDITGLLPDIEIPETAQVNPNTVQDFTDPVKYTVTAEDGSKVVYTVSVTVALDQRQILQTIFDVNPGNTLGWDLGNTVDLGTLEGITTDVEGNIIGLDLAGKKLTQFSPKIGQLTGLTLLFLRNNQLTSIPPEIGQLTGLTILDISFNQLTSIPPEIGQLTRLTDLRLSANQLTSIPSEMGQLTGLIELNLFQNQLTSIPPEIGQLTNLTFLSLQRNQLTSILPEIGQLTSLIELNLSINQLTSIPPEIGQLTSLTDLFLFENQLASIPPEIGQLTSLTNLRLENNQLTSIPQEISQLTALIFLDLRSNNLNTIPIEVCNLGDFVLKDNNVLCSF